MAENSCAAGGSPRAQPQCLCMDAIRSLPQRWLGALGAWRESDISNWLDSRDTRGPPDYGDQ